MRQHVNPLSQFFQIPFELPSLEELYENPESPLHLDIGCARGGFLLDLARRQKDWNYLGVEIRKPLVEAADRDRVDMEIKNLRFLFCNANVSLQSWLQSLRRGVLQRVSIQFPDPWFKRRHYKRRVFQPSLLTALASSLGPGKELFLQSDIFEVVDPMRKLIDLSNYFDLRDRNASPFLTSNPMKIPTEREKHAISKNLPVYRMLYYRNCNKVLPTSTLEEAWIKINNTAYI